MSDLVSQVSDDPVTMILCFAFRVLASPGLRYLRAYNEKWTTPNLEIIYQQTIERT